MRFGIRMIAVLLAVIAATVAMAGTGNAAAQGVNDCPAGNICIWEHRDFGGNILIVPVGVSYPSLHVLTCPGCVSSNHHRSNGTWGDMMSSWYNNSSTLYCWFWNIDFQVVVFMGAGTSVAYVGSFNNDQASAIGPCPQT